MLAELRPVEAAKYLRVAKTTVYELLKTGALEGWRDANGHWRMTRAACNSYIARHEAEQQRRDRGRASAAGETRGGGSP